MINPDKLDEETRAVYPNGVDIHRDWQVDDDGITWAAFKNKRATVDMLLEYTDVELRWYLPSREAIDFMIFIRLCLGEEPENSNSKPHYFMMDCLFQAPNVKPFFMVRNIDFEETKGETVILCSREFSKSTIITYFILYMAAKQKIPNFGRVNYGLYISDSMSNGVKIQMGRIKAIYYESSYLQSCFEEVNITQEEAVFVRIPRSQKELAAYKQVVEVEKRDKKYVPGRMKRTFKIGGKGCLTSTRGAGNALTRLEFAIFDDLVASEKDAASKNIRESIESTIEADVRGGLAPRSFVILVGTPYNKVDPVYSRVEAGIMTPVVFPRAEKMPIDGMKESEFKSVWPDRHTFKSCRKQYVMARKAKDRGNAEPLRKILQEHYLQISSEDDRMIPDELIQWYSISSLNKYLDGYNLYMTTDFTASNDLAGDYSVIMMWATTSNKDWFMLDMIVRRMTIPQQFNECINMIQRWSVKTSKRINVGVEIDGQQQTNIYSLQELQRKHSVWFGFASQVGSEANKLGISRRKSGTDKHGNFMRIQNMFFDKKIFFPEEKKETPDMKELMEELRYISYSGLNSKHDDAIDGISMLGLMSCIHPSVEPAAGNANGRRRNNANDIYSMHEDWNEAGETAYDSYVLG